VRAVTRALVAALLPVALVVGCARPTPTPPPPEAPTAEPQRMRFEATAYSIEGRTAAGTRSRHGIVAADPAQLPLGTRIRVLDAGPYSGEYVVEDTGRAVTGREIDLYLPDDAEAKRFGRRGVQVEVLERGSGRARAR
jgi:3D (Asp-Asp-Asp) domain-containing protein